MRKPVTFDCLYLYRFVSAGATFAFGFNFKDRDKHTVHASVRLPVGLEWSQIQDQSL